MSEPKRLYRDIQDGKIGGVAAGVAEYFNLDVTLVRVAFVLLLVLTGGAMLIAYLLMWLIIPPKPGQRAASSTGAAGPGGP